MKLRTIKSYMSIPYKKLKDKVGALEKSVKLKRMEPYSSIIEEVLSSYNLDEKERTMMLKLIRQPVEGTTTRKEHTENVKEIAGEIADNFDWLNSNITRVMAKEHDVGHTFLGHSGEWWISSINETYGLPNYVHNAIGARKYEYRTDARDVIKKEILRRNPNINPNVLAKIERDLWLIFDGINCHNGEKSEYSYSPDFSKDESRYREELMGCYTKRGFDRTLMPATAEGSLMRLCDKISYIPLDLVDIFRNHLNLPEATINGKHYDFYEEYRKKFSEMGMPERTLDRLLECKTAEDYYAFAREMQEIFIQDVIKNTKRNNIRMSPKMSNVMHSIRDINNKLMVNYTVMKEDHDAYVPALEYLMDYYSKVLLEETIISPQMNNSVSKTSGESTYAKLVMENNKGDKKVSDFLDFVFNTNEQDFEFTVEACKKSFEEITDKELDIAQAVATGKISQDEIKARGNKEKRIDSYINYFQRSLDKAYNENLFDAKSNNPINVFKKNIWLRKTRNKIKSDVLSFQNCDEENNGRKSLREMVGMDLATQYLASLNDRQFFKLLKDFGRISQKQAESLQRPYSSFDFRSEAKPHEAWSNLEKLQIQSLNDEKERKEEKSRGFWGRVFGR